LTAFGIIDAMSSNRVAIMRGGEVFVSHTSELDSWPEPPQRPSVQAALDAVAAARMVPVDMRYFATAPASPAEVCRERVLQSQVYVGVIGFRYGSLVPGLDVSYTELEFDTATEVGLPRLILMLRHPPSDACLVDADRTRIDRFRDKLTGGSGVTVAWFDTADRLQYEVYRGLINLLPTMEVEAGLFEGQRRPTVAGLPHPTGRFIGRAKEVREMLSRIEAHNSPGTVMAVHVIDGMPGVGKTELALHVGHNIADRFPDGSVFLDLAGYSPGLEAVPPVEALRILLGQRGVTTGHDQQEARLRALWRNECARHRLLIILDNARDRDQVAPLLPDVPGCLVLVTSRRKLIGLPGGTPFPLDPFEREEATELLLASAEVAATAQDAAVQRVVTLCERLPLAVGIAASMLAHRPGYGVAELADDLDAERRYLDDLGEDDGSLHVAVHASIRLSFRHLPKDLMKAFRLCGWHPGPEVTEPALAAVLTECVQGDCAIQVTDRTLARSRRLLLGLADRNLIRQQTTDRPRYRMHDLVRASARLSRTEESEHERWHALSHLTWAYRATLERVESWRYGGAPGIPPLRPNDTPLDTFADLAGAVSWVLLERENLLALVDAMDERSAFVSSLLAAQLRDRGFLADARHCYEDAETGYARMGLDGHRAHALRGLAHIAVLAGDHNSARRDYNRARAINRRQRDDIGQALALRGLGTAARMVDDYGGAAAYLGRAISMLATHPKVRGRDPLVVREYALALAELGLIETARGHRSNALALWSSAYQAHVMTGDICGQHAAVTALAEIKRMQGDLTAARAYLDEVHRSVSEFDDPICEADALWELGQLQKEADEPGVAVATFERALELRQEFGTPLGSARALLGLAEAERLDGQLDTARRHFDGALRCCLEYHDRDGVAQSHLGLGDVAAAMGDQALAVQCWQGALDVATEIGLDFVIRKARGRLTHLGA
jgi:tetratricopeptide (TPR) repeat protein